MTILNSFQYARKLARFCVIFRPNSALNRFDNELIYVIRTQFYDSPIFSLFPKNSEPTGILSGYYHLVSKNNHMAAKKLNGFGCHIIDCLATILSTFDRITDYGRKLEWQLKMGSTEVSSNKRRGPTFAKRFPKLKQGMLVDTLYEFLVKDLERNLSAMFDHRSRRIEFLPHGVQGTYSLSTSSPLEFPISLKTSHNFITADTVSAVTLDYDLYMSPFDSSVWICIAFSIVVMAHIYTAELFSGAKYPLSSAMANKIFRAISLVGVLVEQGVEIRKQDLRPKSTSPFIILGVWLLTGIVLSNGYKGFMKTSVITGTELMTKWKRLNDLHNFTLFYPVGGSFLNKGMGLRFCTQMSQQCSRSCNTLSHEFHCTGNNKPVLIRKTSSASIFPEQFEPFCADDLDIVIENNLTKPRTALVFPSDELEYFWTLVSQAVRDKNLRFSNNRKTRDDPTLRNPVSLYMNQMFDEKYHYVARRARVMMSAGLYSFWEKWDSIQFPTCYSSYFARKEPSEETVKALSMQSSLILALYAFLWSLLACGVIFGLEFMTLSSPNSNKMSGPESCGILPNTKSAPTTKAEMLEAAEENDE